MKILIANHRYFVSGGPERYLFNISSALKSQYHEVIPFSIKYKYNFETEYFQYFVPPIGNDNEIYYKDQNNSARTLIKTTKRLFSDSEVEKAIRRIAFETNPDIAYVLHYLRKLSPALLVGLKKENIPIIVRLSDFGMLCPQAHFLRNDLPCERCLNGNLLNSVIFRCVQGNLSTSIMNYIATKYHSWSKYFDLIDRFVVTNKFMYQKMVEAGYKENQLCLIPTFVDTADFYPTAKKQKNLIVYSGRIERIKGIHLLIEALNIVTNRLQKKYELLLLGEGDITYSNYLSNLINKFGLTNIRFLGNKGKNEIRNNLSRALISIIPSLWYENLPNSLLESYACGTAVIGSNHGSLSDSIIDGKTGLLFEPGSAKDLANKIAYALSEPEQMIDMGKNARGKVESDYSSTEHLDKLIELFKQVIYQYS